MTDNLTSLYCYKAFHDNFHKNIIPINVRKGSFFKNSNRGLFVNSLANRLGAPISRYEKILRDKNIEHGKTGYCTNDSNL